MLILILQLVYSECNNKITFKEVLAASWKCEIILATELLFSTVLFCRA